MMKSFSTVKDTQRGTQSYMEKRRGRREIEVTRRRRGRIKRSKTDPAQVFPTAQNTQRDSQCWVEKRRGREEIEATWWTKRRVQRGREKSSR